MAQLEQFDNRGKLPAHKDRIRGYLRTGSTYPISLEIDATNLCPLDCDYCIWHGLRAESKASMKSDTLLRLVDEAAEIGVQAIVWTGGGEPLVNQGTLPAIQRATEKGIKSGMFSTAVPMTKEASDILVANLSWVRFHIDGASPESYAQKHNSPARFFDMATRNIEYFTRRRAETNSSTGAGIGTVAFESNLGEAPALAELAKVLGLDFFQYKHDLTQMKDTNYLCWWEQEVVPVMDQISQQLEDDKFKVQYSKGVSYGEVDQSPNCHVHQLNTAITADGRVAFCKSTRDKKQWSLGSVYDGKSLKQIFDDPGNQQLRQSLTPSTCGILPCPLKAPNMLIEQIVSENNIDLLPDNHQPILHQEFL